MCIGGGSGGEIEETSDQKELAQIGIDQWNDYQQMYPEVEQEFFDSVGRLNSAGTKQRAANDGAVNTGSAYSDVREGALESLSSQGVNPNSGGFKQAITGIGESESMSRTHNANQTQQAVQDSYLQGKASITGMGLGQQAEAIQGFSQIASDSGRKAIDDAYQDYGESSNRRSTIATGAGVALGAYDNSRKGVDNE